MFYVFEMSKILAFQSPDEFFVHGVHLSVSEHCQSYALCVIDGYVVMEGDRYSLLRLYKCDNFD